MRPRRRPRYAGGWEAEGEAPWEAMEIEVYPGNGHSLVIARPAAEGVYISAWGGPVSGGSFSPGTPGKRLDK